MQKLMSKDGTPIAFDRSGRGPALERYAHTLLYDQAVMGETMSGKPFPRNRWGRVTMPALVMDGGAGPAWFGNAADQLAEILRDARRTTLPGQNHGADRPAIHSAVVGTLSESDRAPRVR